MVNIFKDVDKQDIDKFCKSRNIEYFTTSANNGENVNEVNLHYNL